MGKCCLYSLIVHHTFTLHTSSQHWCFLHYNRLQLYKTSWEKHLTYLYIQPLKSHFWLDMSSMIMCLLSIITVTKNHTSNNYNNTAVNLGTWLYYAVNRVRCELVYFRDKYYILWNLGVLSQSTCSKAFLPVITTEILLNNFPQHVCPSR